MDHGFVSDLAICIIAAWICAVGAQLLRQPLILAYLVAGCVIGPIGLGLVKSKESIETISEIGLILLLFMIGLEIDLKKIASAGRLIFVTSIAQVLGGTLLGVGFFWISGFALGEGRLDALYLAVAAALSSTVIIVKILYEKSELDTFSGRITLGILVIQDLFAILFLAVQPNLQNASFALIGMSLGKVVVLVVLAFAASKYILPAIFKQVAKLPELVLVGALAWCFLVAGAAGAMHLSMEMGALIAGVAISTFPYTLDVAAKVTSLRDFFVTLFFVALGMAIPVPTGNIIGWALLVAAFLVVSRLVTVFIPLYLMGQGFRASLLPGINLSQISELSLVILTLGAQLKHIEPQTQGIMAYAFVLLAVASTYGIVGSNSLVQFMEPLLKRIRLHDMGEHDSDEGRHNAEPSIFILGFTWTASSLLEELGRNAPHLTREVLVIDFNPKVHEELKRRGVRVIYGDITQRDTLLHAGIANAEIIISTVPNTLLKGATNLKLVQQLRQLNKTAQIIAHAEWFGDVPKLYAAGANYVSLPRLIEAQELCGVILAAKNKLLEEKRTELQKKLTDRQEVIP